MSVPQSTESRFVVLKFGGTSVATPERWKTILTQAQSRLTEGLRPVVVCSAVTKVSDLLEKLLAAAVDATHLPLLADIKKRHTDLAAGLGIDFESSAGAAWAELERMALGASLLKDNSPRVKARIMAMGEILSTQLGVAFMKKSHPAAHWVDARDCFLSVDEDSRSETQRMLNATVDDDTDEELYFRFAAMDPNTIIVTQGFIARDASGATVLLGRGGSDTSAAYFAAKLDAVRCEIWTDVPGIFSADPRVIPSALFVKQVGYGEGQEIASMGAKVLHPRCIAPCRKHRIPMQIRWTERPDYEGTKIEKSEKSGDGVVKALSHKRGVTLVSMDTPGMWQQVGFLADIFTCFKSRGLSIDLVSTSETNVTVSLDASANTLDTAALEGLTHELAPWCKVKLIPNCASVSLVGRKIRTLLHELGPALSVLEEHHIHLVSQAASDLNLTVVVDEERAERLVKALHTQLFVAKHLSSETFGPSWRELYADDQPETASGKNAPWWLTKRAELLAVAESSTPAYAYHAPTIRDRIETIRKLPVDRVFYSMKANSNIDVLKWVAKCGSGFECVSMGELEQLRSHVPSLDTSDILFTPNFAPKSEYEAALKHNVRVTIDNLALLEKWKDLWRGRDIFLRLDVGLGRGHHAHVKTQGSASKFGILSTESERAAKLAAACGAKIVGLHAHAGSGILDATTWAELATRLAELKSVFPDVHILDIGGGFGVPERQGQASVDFQEVSNSLSQFRAAHPGFELWLEPGRFFVAEAGVLVTRVTQVKQKSGTTFIGVDAGMHTLIRPALYGAHHEIFNLSRLDDKNAVTATIVGPICESGDVLGRGRRLPTTKEGDVLLIANAGAYGRAMSSTYNLRNLPEECLLSF